MTSAAAARAARSGSCSSSSGASSSAAAATTTSGSTVSANTSGGATSGRCGDLVPDEAGLVGGDGVLEALPRLDPGDRGRLGLELDLGLVDIRRRGGGHDGRGGDPRVVDEVLMPVGGLDGGLDLRLVETERTRQASGRQVRIGPCSPAPLAAAGSASGSTSAVSDTMSCVCVGSSLPGIGAHVRQRPSPSFQQSPHVYWRQVRQKLKVWWNASSWWATAASSCSLRASAIASENEESSDRTKFLIPLLSVRTLPIRERRGAADFERVSRAAPFAERLGEDFGHSSPPQPCANARFVPPSTARV